MPRLSRGSNGLPRKGCDCGVPSGTLARARPLTPLNATNWSSNLITLTHAALAAGVLFGTPAIAQTTPPAAPAPQAQTAAPAPVTDEEVTKFARAALAADAVTKDASIPAADKTAKMTEAVTGAGLDTGRFNQIATLAQTDPAVKDKVQAAIIAVRDGPQAAVPAPAASPTPGGQQ